ncbi:MAG: Holliday junction resolvase RuvX [Phycisphaeraceae bacterium]|nr:Holliday junction resolvase RuvX [Phycisphaeraceae bacterium]
MHYLAIDLGAKRTGLASGDDRSGIATPAGVIVTSSAEERWRQLQQAIKEYEPDALVVGLALNMDGSEGDSAKRTRAFAEELTRRTGLPVHLHDERLTSAAADGAMARTGLTHSQKKARRDALAAMTLLHDFLLSLRNPNEPQA